MDICFKARPACLPTLAIPPLVTPTWAAQYVGVRFSFAGKDRRQRDREVGGSAC